MNLILREAGYADLPLMMAWRSNAEIYKGFYQQIRPLTWDEHYNWFCSRNQDWRTLIVFCEDGSTYQSPINVDGTEFETIPLRRPIGVVTLGQLDHWSPEIGYYIGEIGLWGKGVGTEAVRLGIEWVRGYASNHTHVTHIHTTVKDDNIASQKIMRELGFKKGMEARGGEHYWIRKL